MSECPPPPTFTDPLAPEIPLARPILAAPPAPALRGAEMLLFDLPPRQAWTDIGWLALGLVLSELAITAILQVASLVFLESGPWADEQSRRTMLIPNLVLRAGGCVVLVLILVHRRKLPVASSGIRSEDFFADLGLGLVTVLVTYAVVLAVLIPSMLFSNTLRGQMEENANRIMEMIPKLAPHQFLFMALMIGVYEEVVFRGFLMPRLRRALGSWPAAVLVSTAVFTLLHALDQTAMALVVVTILSLLFSVVTIWRRSILPAVVAHTLFDLSQFLLLSFQAGDHWE